MKKTFFLFFVSTFVFSQHLEVNFKFHLNDDLDPNPKKRWLINQSFFFFSKKNRKSINQSIFVSEKFDNQSINH